MGEPMNWTIKLAATEFGVAAETIRRGLSAAGVEVKKGRGSSFTTKQIVAAIFGDIKHERFLKTREERTLLELERKQKEGELVSMNRAKELLVQYMMPARQRFLSVSSEMASKCNPTDPVHAQKALDEWAQRSLRQCQMEIQTPTQNEKEREKKKTVRRRR